jgi:hypothetical protein
MSFIPVIQIFTSDPEISNSNPIAYSLTDHNRQALEISYDVIEDSNRMADGTMRKFVTANKKKISVSWQTVPAAGGRNFTADGNLGAAWLKSFYEENIFKPVWIKMTYAQENWAFAGQNAVSSYLKSGVNDPPNASAANFTYFPTQSLPASAAYQFYISNASFTNFSNGTATATLTTSVPHNLNINTSPYIYVTGIDQIFNGTWKISSASNNKITYIFGSSPNVSADFNINSYVQSGSIVTLNVDNNDFISVGASININNSKGFSGIYNNINNGWIVTGASGQNIISASNSSYSGSSYGYYGSGTIVSTNSKSKNLNQIYPGFVGPAITSDIIKAFITNFSYNVTHRYALTDFVDMNIEFTEI